MSNSTGISRWTAFKSRPALRPPSVDAIYCHPTPAPSDGPTAAMNPATTRPLVALTGATGFIGQWLLKELPKRGYRLRVLLRRPSAVPIDAASAVVGDLARPQNMAAALA